MGEVRVTLYIVYFKGWVRPRCGLILLLLCDILIVLMCFVHMNGSFSN